MKGIDFGLNPDHWLNEYTRGLNMTDIEIKSNGITTGRFSCDEVIISNIPHEAEMQSVDGETIRFTKKPDGKYISHEVGTVLSKLSREWRNEDDEEFDEYPKVYPTAQEQALKNANTQPQPAPQMGEGFSKLPLNEMAMRINTWAQEKGWNDKPLQFGDMISLFHTELSEAYEEYRNGHIETDVYTKDDDFIPVGGYKYFKPLGIPTEIADLFIRLLHFCAYHQINIEMLIAQKMEYNARRSYRHGNKVT